MGLDPNFSWFNTMSVEQIFIAMKDECRQIENQFARECVQIGLEKLIRATYLKPEFRNHKLLQDTWRTIQPELRESGILKSFDTLVVRDKIKRFVRGI